MKRDDFSVPGGVTLVLRLICYCVRLYIGYPVFCFCSLILHISFLNFVKSHIKSRLIRRNYTFSEK